ncbi:hypothetical protein KIN20_033534 [Parelaphostrongylus tenuis]|uniref:Bardet-Biedl syndrome 1 N-terminal domain-containing protein n=1 Tax=Parelaphostrongylus tenuis TaxID=148309 RepID=A0AAD5RAG5_PARTN|nr:hypothetical protein KIN20_033534 [Parelaphostrongylus tenuis]
MSASDDVVKWMSALSDDQAGLYTFSNCVCLSDMYGDGDTKLVVAHIGSSKFNMRLKVIKGVTLVGECALAEMPTAIVSFYNEKYNTPSAPIHSVEQEAWTKTAAKQLTHDQLFTVIQNLANEISAKLLTPISQTLLTVKPEERPAFIDYYAVPKYVNNFRNPETVTCLSTMPKSTIDNLEVLVFGTERGMVFVVDSQAFQIIGECRISGIPVQIVTYGVFDVEYRLFVSTRNGNIFCLKRNQTIKEKAIISCKTDIVSFNILNKIIAVATTDHMLFFYSFAGKCLNTIAIGESIKGLEPFRYAPKQFEGILVMLENQIRLYTHLHLLDIIKTEHSLSWIKFGQFGREQGALIIGTNDGGLLVKLFRRKASLDERIDLAAPPKAYNIKLNIPKKSRIFIDQTMRERDNVNQINQTYQRDLFLIKYYITKAFAEMSASSADPISTDPNHSVNIAVTVNGFGPKFRLNVKLSCTAKIPLYNLWLSMVFSPNIYRFEQTLIPVSILMPGHFYTFTTLVECLEPEKGLSEDVRVLLIKPDKPTPIVTAIVTMPVSEPNVLD